MITDSSTLIGPAANYLRAYSNKFANRQTKPVRLLFYGPPGVGKTTLALALAHLLAKNDMAIEHVAGRNVVADMVREWISSMSYTSMFGDMQVKLIDECDLCTETAQDLMLTYLDRMTERHAVIATANCEPKHFTPRFQSRFQQLEVTSPTVKEVVALISDKFPKLKQAGHIVPIINGCMKEGGVIDVRATLNDAECANDFIP